MPRRGTPHFLIVAPQGDAEEHDDADRRLRRALTELRSEGVNVHGQIVHPDPYTAAMHVVNDERVDEIIVSTFPGEKSGWLRRDLVDRLRKDTGLPVDHVYLARPPGGGLMSAAAEAHEHHGPPPIHYSSRISPLLGIFLFIGSEIMLFGSFFTVYFFCRVVNTATTPSAARGYHRPVFVALSTRASWSPRASRSTGRHLRQAREPRGLQAGLTSRSARATFLLTQLIEYHRIGFNTSDAHSPRRSSA